MLKTIFCLFALFFWMSGCAGDGTVADDGASTGDDSGAAVEEPAEEPAEEPVTSCDSAETCAAAFDSAECNPSVPGEEAVSGNSWNYEEALADEFSEEQVLCIAGYADADEFALGCLTYDGAVVTAGAAEDNPCDLDVGDGGEEDEEGGDPDVACDWTANNGFGDSLESYVCWVFNSEDSIFLDNGAPTLADGILTFSAAPVASPNNNDSFYMTRLIDLSADTTVTLTISSVEGGTFENGPPSNGDMITFGFGINGGGVVTHRLETTAGLSYNCSATNTNSVPCATSMPLYLRLKLVDSTVTAYYGTDPDNLTAFIGTTPADDIVGRSDASLDLTMFTSTDAGTFEVRFSGLEITQP